MTLINQPICSLSLSNFIAWSWRYLCITDADACGETVCWGWDSIPLAEWWFITPFGVWLCWPHMTGACMLTLYISIWFFSSTRFLFCFLSFARRFWNQIFTCLSDRPKVAANSAFLRIVMYLLTNVNSFSSSIRWWSVYTTLYLSFVLVFPVTNETQIRIG